jgi:2-polyprenyl-3-methyl-5-hydroxy-6-metoxy-1,4-benzoquinol methylase
MTTESAKEWWKNQKKYPFDFTRNRRIHELNYLVPKLQKIEGYRLLDLGCGDGALLECLSHLTNFKGFFGYDIAENLLKKIKPSIATFVYDISEPTELPEMDVVIIAGVLQYLFEEDHVKNLLSKVNAPVVFVRSTCTLKEEDEIITNDGYTSKYRTIKNTLSLFSDFEVCSIDRVYPDEIESPFGTKQFYFELRKK